MASFFNKIKIANSVQTRNSFDLSHINLTTQGFYALKPVYAKELMPNESIDIDYSQFCRLFPLEEPMLAHVNIVTKAFYVPYRVVWPLFNSFITGVQATYRGLHYIPNQVPVVAMSNLIDFLKGQATVVTEGVDFYVDSVGYRLTAHGRRCFDILLNLGYSINFSQTDDDVAFSALPLLSLFRVYYDWCQNTNYDNLNTFTDLLDLGDGYILTSSQIADIFSYITLCQYRTDLFTSAFDKPTGPNVITRNVSFPLQKSAPTGGVETVEKSESLFEGTPSVATAGGVRFTQNGLYVLHALTDYYQRLRATGSRVLDRYFGEFGVKLSDETLQRSSYLGGSENEIKVFDVMDNSSTGLGDYAGQGLGDVNGHVQFSSKEFGMLFILTYIEPRTSVCQGFDRNLLHRNRFDFFQGDLDAIGYQAISKGEVFADFKGPQFSSWKNQTGYSALGIFGYSGRFYEYKCAHDKLTGDFRNASVNAGYDRWHLFRMQWNGVDVSGSSTDIDYGEPLVHSLQFTTPSKPEVYNRVFGSILSFDPFFCRWSFKVKASLPAKPLFEQYEYASHGQKEVVNLGGTRVTG